MRTITLLIILLVAANTRGQNAINNGLQQMLGEELTSNGWIIKAKSIYTEDANGYLQDVVHSSFYTASNTWEYSLKTSYTVNAEGNFEIAYNYPWNGEEFNLLTQDVYSYNSAGNIASLVSKQWNGENWYNTTEQIYYYDANGYLVKRESYSLLSDTPEITSRVMLTNDAGGKVLESLFQYIEGSGWVDNSKTTYSYNQAGQLATTTFLNFPNPWFLGQNDYTYDAQGRVSQLMEYSYNTNVLTSTKRRSYVYNTLGVEESDFANIRVFPNPATDRLQISAQVEIKSVSACGADGRLFGLNYRDGAIDVSTLAQGMYVLMAETEYGASRTKFIKK